MTDREIIEYCPRCGARIYPGDIACQICDYPIGSRDDTP